jgi:hypothetical protein
VYAPLNASSGVLFSITMTNTWALAAGDGDGDGDGDGAAAPPLVPHADKSSAPTINAIGDRKNPRDTAI